MTGLSGLMAERDRQRPRTFRLGDLTVWDTRFSHQDRLTPTLRMRVVPSARLLMEMADNGGDVAIIGSGKYCAQTTPDRAGEWLNDDEVILFPMGGSAYNVKYHNGPFCTANYIGKTADESTVLTGYLALWLEEHAAALDRMFVGSGLRSPDMRAILRMEVDVPSLGYQARAVAALTAMRERLAEMETRPDIITQRLNMVRDGCLGKIIQARS
ncbi:MAG: restriction endonuclease subunit S [Pseudoflavonifractor sp.]|nr:restriction endonuclease subunit S [Pseudoflavonifractor sp.]